MRLYSRALKAPLISLIANCQHNPVNWMHLDLFADSNECSSSPCTPTEQCIDQVDGYLCIEFDEGGVSTHFKMIDHCSYSPCVHGTCNNDLAKNFTCVCEVGFTGPTCADGMCMWNSIWCHQMWCMYYGNLAAWFYPKTVMESDKKLFKTPKMNTYFVAKQSWSELHNHILQQARQLSKTPLENRFSLAVEA